MPTVTGGGASNISGDQITDGSIANADIAVDADIEQHKIEPSQGDNTDLVNFETTTGVTHSLTTVAGQRVLVTAKGNFSDIDNRTATVELKYNGVVQDTIRCGSAGAGGDQKHAFCLTCELEPGAATADITVTADDQIENVKITVIKVMADA